MRPLLFLLSGSVLATAPHLAFAEVGKGEQVAARPPAAAYDECRENMPPAFGKAQQIEDDWMRFCLFGEEAYTPEHPDPAPIYEACRLEMNAIGVVGLDEFQACVVDKTKAVKRR